MTAERVAADARERVTTQTVGGYHPTPLGTPRYDGFPELLTPSGKFRLCWASGRGPGA